MTWTKRNNIWVPNRSLADTRGFISPAIIGAVAGSRRRVAASYVDTINADNPIAWWRLGETSGTTAVDEKGLADGTYTGTYTLGVSGAISDGNKAFSMEGAGYMVAPDRAGWDVTSGSVEAWFKTATSGTYKTIMRRDAGTGARNFLLRVSNTNKLEALLIFGGNPSIASAASVNDDAFHHAVLTWAQNGANTDMELFLDGASQGTNTATALSPASDRLVYVGATHPGNAEVMNGSIDEAAFYNTALSGARVLAHYNAR